MKNREHGVLTESAWIYLEDGIVVVEFRDHAVVDLEEARQHSSAVSELTGGKSAPLLMVFGKMKKQTKEARDYFTRHPEHVALYTATALLVKNPLAQVFASFFLGINRSGKPTRMFTARERAISWLEQYR